MSICEHKTKGIASVPIIHPLQSYRCPDCGDPVWFCDACGRGHRITEEEFTAEWTANNRPEVAGTGAIPPSSDTEAVEATKDKTR